MSRRPMTTMLFTIFTLLLLTVFSLLTTGSAAIARLTAGEDAPTGPDATVFKRYPTPFVPSRHHIQPTAPEKLAGNPNPAALCDARVAGYNTKAAERMTACDNLPNLTRAVQTDSSASAGIHGGKPAKSFGIMKSRAKQTFRTPLLPLFYS